MGTPQHTRFFVHLQVPSFMEWATIVALEIAPNKQIRRDIIDGRVKPSQTKRRDSGNITPCRMRFPDEHNRQHYKRPGRGTVSHRAIRDPMINRFSLRTQRKQSSTNWGLIVNQLGSIGRVQAYKNLKRERRSRESILPSSGGIRKRAAPASPITGDGMGSKGENRATTATISRDYPAHGSLFQWR